MGGALQAVRRFTSCASDFRLVQLGDHLYRVVALLDDRVSELGKAQLIQPCAEGLLSQLTAWLDWRCGRPYHAMRARL